MKSSRYIRYRIRKKLISILRSMKRPNLLDGIICTNINDTAYDYSCLLLYVTAPFLSNKLNRTHQLLWQVRELVRIIGEFGYNVDVTDFLTSPILEKKYDLVVDIHPQPNPSYKSAMKQKCKRVGYITGSNPTFSNYAEKQRLIDLQKRRNLNLNQRRFVIPFDKKDFESLSAIFFIGNSYNLQTYKDFNLKNVSFIKNTGYPEIYRENYQRKSAKNFLFLASYGQVHKGLDLLLEVFYRHQDLHLFVCSSFDKEKDFYKAYKTELFKSSNIHPIGFIDIDSQCFNDVVQQCSYVVLPSCSEGIAGSVLTGMSAGLIPIISRECGFEEDEAFFFENCQIDTIEKTLSHFSQKDLAWIIHESKKAYSIICDRYNYEHFTKTVRLAMGQLENLS